MTASSYQQLQTERHVVAFKIRHISANEEISLRCLASTSKKNLIRVKREIDILTKLDSCPFVEKIEIVLIDQ